MKKPRKIIHDIPENKIIEYCDEIGVNSETDTENSFPTEICNSKWTYWRDLAAKTKTFFQNKNYKKIVFHVIIATEILSITGV